MYPSFAFGIGLDSTQVQADNADDDEVSYNSYGGAFTGRLDTGRFALSTTAAYYVGERTIGGRIGDELPLRGPGVGAVAAVRLGIGSAALEAGPYVRFFYVRATEDDRSTDDYDERGLRVRSLAFGVSIGVMFGGPPTSDVEDSF